MGKCNKELVAILLAEFLASLFVQFVGCMPAPLVRLSHNTTHKDVQVEKFFDGWGYAGGYFPHLNEAKRLNKDTIPFPKLSSDVFESDSKISQIHDPSPLLYAFAWGGAVLAATQAFRIVSGAHINPCITVAAMILKNIKVVDGLLYILMQLLGSLGGYGLSYALFRSQHAYIGTVFCVTNVNVTPWWKSILLEFFMTGAWVLAMCSSWHPSNEAMLESISLRIGLVVLLACLVGGKYTGASMNPFRSLWPALGALYFTHIYIYLLIPLIAAILLALIWRFLFLMGEGKGKEAADE